MIPSMYCLLYLLLRSLEAAKKGDIIEANIDFENTEDDLLRLNLALASLIH